MPSSGIRASDDEIREGRPSGVLTTHSTRDGTSLSHRSFGESERKSGDIIAERYVLDSVIAQGGMGVVWRAYDRERGQHVAVKLVAPRLLVAEDAAARLCAEAKLLMLIDSPHVARILDAGTMLDGAPYMVTELLQGVTLQQLLEAHTSIPIHQAVEWICQAASGLADVHQVGLVHDDLKPSNLFLAEAGGPQARIKLLDFGIARILSDPSALSARGDVIGNPCYMAPERIAGSWYADHRADIWSLGVVMYELATARRPFDGATLNDICTAVMAAAPPSMRELRPEVNPELEEAVLRCLQPQPEDRYSNARLLLLDLERSLASLVVAVPASEDHQAPSKLETERPLIAQTDSAVIVRSTVAEPSDSVANVEPFVRSDSAANVEPFVRSDSAANIEPFGQSDSAANIEPFGQSDSAANVEPFGQSDSAANVEPFGQSEFSSAQSSAPAPEDTASIRAAKLRSIVQAPSLQFPRVAQRLSAPAAVPQQVNDDEAPPLRRRRRGPAVIAYALAITFVSVVGIVAAARSMRSGPASGQTLEQPTTEQGHLPIAQPPVEASPNPKPQEPDGVTEAAPARPVDARTVIVPENPAKEAPPAQPGEATTIVLPTKATQAPIAPQDTPARATTPPPAPDAKSSAARPRTESRSKAPRMDTSPPQGIPLRDVHINARGELTDAKGKPLPMPAPQQ